MMREVACKVNDLVLNTLGVGVNSDHTRRPEFNCEMSSQRGCLLVISAAFRGKQGTWSTPRRLPWSRLTMGAEQVGQVGSEAVGSVAVASTAVTRVDDGR